MKNVYKISAIILLFTISFSNFSCSKTDLGNLDEYDVSFESVESVMQTEAMLNVAFIDIFNIGLRAGAFADEQSLSKKAGGGASEDLLGGEMLIKFVGDQAVIPLYVEVDWGQDKKIGDDGFSRKGKIIAKVTKINWENKGSVIEMSFRDYYFQGHKVTGFVTLINSGDDIYEMKIEDAAITSPDEKIAHRDSDLIFKWIEGKEDRKDIKEDVWHIYGNVTGITSNGMEYEIVIEEDNYLTKSICKYPTRGVADFMIKKVKFSLDYAPVDEACDNIAEVDFYGKKKIIELGEEEE